MEKMNEKLLSAWLRLSTSVINNRLVSDLSYNESLICNILYNTQIENPTHLLTATDLCNETHMLKSQMNRTLNHLEEKNFITRVRSSGDKRQVFVKFNPDAADIYFRQHQKILALMDNILAHLGPEKSEQTLQVLTTICEVADNTINNMERND